MSEEERDLEFRHLDEGLVTTAKLCIKSFKECRKLYKKIGKSVKSKRKAGTTYPELEYCPLNDIPEDVVDPRGNRSPMILPQFFPFWPMLTIVLMF